MSKGLRAASDQPSGPGAGGLPPPDERVLVVDCQWDGPLSAAVLLEIGWVVDTLGGSPAAAGTSSFVVRPADPGSVSDRTLALTGLTRDDLESGTGACDVAVALTSALGGVSAVVAHAARYERALLSRLLGPGAVLPPFHCTLEAARRLLPGLSGYGLRAVSGYLGIPPPARKRVEDQVEATRLVLRVLSDLGAGGPAALPAIHRRRGLQDGCSLRIDLSKLRALPAAPGVYRLLDCAGNPLYIGKADSIRGRVRQHFSPASWKAKDGLLSAIWDVDWTGTATGTEAALLEAELISVQRPMSNRALTRLPERLCWLSPDLSGCGTAPSRELTLGPVAGARVFSELLLVARAFSGSLPAEVLPQSLGWLGDPGPGELTRSLGILRETGVPDSGDPAEILAWAATLPETEEGVGPTSPAEETAARLLSVLSGAAAAAARASRIASLACSVQRFTWRGRARMLRRGGGRVVEAAWADEGGTEGPCPPPGHPVPDVMSYRRLSVLSGEMYRMASIAENAGPSGPASPIKQAGSAGGG